MASVFLYAPQDFNNISLLARTLEVFGQTECYVFDPHGMIRDRYGKARTRQLRTVSAGAFDKIRWLHVADPDAFLAEHRGRVVATVVDEGAQSLTRYEFKPTTVLLFGSEGHGLPQAVVDTCAAAVTIPMRGQTQSLNLAVALGIVLFERQRQLESMTEGGAGVS